MSCIYKQYEADQDPEGSCSRQARAAAAPDGPQRELHLELSERTQLPSPSRARSVSVCLRHGPLHPGLRQSAGAPFPDAARGVAGVRHAPQAVPEGSPQLAQVRGCPLLAGLDSLQVGRRSMEERAGLSQRPLLQGLGQLRPGPIPFSLGQLQRGCAGPLVLQCRRRGRCSPVARAGGGRHRPGAQGRGHLQRWHETGEWPLLPRSGGEAGNCPARRQEGPYPSDPRQDRQPPPGRLAPIQPATGEPLRRNPRGGCIAHETCEDPNGQVGARCRLGPVEDAAGIQVRSRRHRLQGGRRALHLPSLFELWLSARFEAERYRRTWSKGVDLQ